MQTAIENEKHHHMIEVGNLSKIYITVFRKHGHAKRSTFTLLQIYTDIQITKSKQTI